MNSVRKSGNEFHDLRVEGKVRVRYNFGKTSKKFNIHLYAPAST